MIEKNDRMTMARTGEVRTRGRRNLMSLCTGTVLVLSAVASFASPVLAQEINPVDEISNPQANEFQRVVMAIEDFDTPFVRDGVLREREAFVPVERAMTKEQVRQLVGEPVRMENSLADKWVYQIKFVLPESNNFIVCQYNIMFDMEQFVDAAVWRRRQCERLAEGEPLIQ